MTRSSPITRCAKNNFVRWENDKYVDAANGFSDLSGGECWGVHVRRCETVHIFLLLGGMCLFLL